MASTTRVRVTVNGETHDAEVEARTLLA